MKNKLLDKITKHTSDIILGILSGSGLMFIIVGLTALITLLIPVLQPYFIIIYVIFYLFILISTSLLFTKGWFRIFYLTSALILLLTYVYTKIFGAI